MPAPLRLIIGSEYDPKIEELTSSLTSPRPLPHKAIPVVEKVSARSCKIMIDENCIPNQGDLLGNLWDTRYMLRGFVRVPEFAHNFKVLISHSERAEALVLHNRFPGWNKFQTSLGKSDIIWQYLNSANLDVMRVVLSSMVNKYRKELVKYCLDGTIFIAHKDIWFYGAGFFETQGFEVFSCYYKVKPLEIEAVTTAIDYGSILAWPVLQVGLVMHTLQKVAEDKTVKKSKDWKHSYGFTPSQINTTLALLHKWGAPLAREFHFNEAWKTKNYKIHCPATKKALEQMCKESMVKPTTERYTYYKLTPWGKITVQEVYETVLKNYNHQSYANFLEVLRRRVEDIVLRDYYKNYKSARNYIALVRKGKSPR